MRHRLSALVAAAVLVSAACDDEDDAADGRAPTSSASLAAEPTGLADDEYTAACLTDIDPTDPRSDIRADLCIGNLAGDFRILRTDIDGGIGPAVSDDGTRVAFVVDEGLHVLDLAGGEEVDLGVAARAPRWLPDGRVAFIAPDERSVRAVEVDEDRPASTIVDATVLDDLGEGWSVESFAVSPDQRSIALSMFRSNEAESALALVDTESGDSSFFVGPGGEPVQHPDFSPDGGRLAYVQGVLLFVHDTSGGEPQLVSPAEWYAVTPTWSPDGTQLLWLANAAEVPDGPAALVVAPVADPDAFRVIVGNDDRPLERFPAFPDWPSDRGAG